MTNLHPAVIGTRGARCGVCGADAIAQWRRRLTAEELATHLVTVKEARGRALAQGGNSDDLEPLPTAADVTMAVGACADHSISLESAAQIHRADCPAPHQGHLPACGCQPEPISVLQTHPAAAEAVLPPGWDANNPLPI